MRTRHTPAAETPIATEAAPAEASEPKEPKPKRKKVPKKPRHRLAQKPGQAPSEGVTPCLLCDELEDKICGFLREGASIVDSAVLAGVSAASVCEWRAHGSQEPESRFGQFYERTELARATWKHRGVCKLSDHADPKNIWRLLCSRYPQEFRNYFSAELSGPSGEPIPVQVNPFNVTVTLEANSEQLEREFTIHEPAKNGNGA
jgi:hypothetical protein